MSTKPFPNFLKKVFLDCDVTLGTDSPDCGRLIDGYLGSLDGSQGSGDTTFFIRTNGSGSFTGLRENRPVFEAETPGEAFLQLQQALFQYAVERHAGCLAFHSAALLYPESNTVVLIPGPGKSGKTSIACACLETGAFLYVTEDVLFIDPATFTTLVFPRSLKLRTPWTPDRFASKRWDTMPAVSSGEFCVRPPAELIVHSRRVPRPSMALFPHRDAGPGADLLEVSQGETLARLMASWIGDACWEAREGLDAVRSLAAAMRGWRIRWSDPHAAAHGIKSLIQKRLL